MAIIQCYRCGRTYDNDPIFFDNGKIECPFCKQLRERKLQKPKIGLAGLLLFLFLFALAAGCIYVLPNILAIIVLAIDIIVIIILISSELSMIKAYYLSRKDPEAFLDYQLEQERKSNKAIERMDRLEEYRQTEATAKAEELNRLPACPICGSKHSVKRLSNLNRSVSIFAVGLASAKIGKQYECTHCKHYF